MYKMPRKLKTRKVRKPKKIVKVVSRRKRVRSSIMRMPRRNNLIVAPKMFSKFKSIARFYIASTGVSVGYFDVGMNLNTPWVQSQAYDTAPRVASLSTPASAANGFEGLANWLTGLAGDKFYQKYRVHGARLNVRIIPNVSNDAGDVCIVPYKSGDVINSTLATGSIAPFSKNGRFNVSKGANISSYISIPKLWGIPKLAIAINPDYSSVGGAAPALGSVFRVLYGKGDGATCVGSLEFEVHLTIYAELFDTTIGGQPETVV